MAFWMHIICTWLPNARYYRHLGHIHDEACPRGRMHILSSMTLHKLNRPIIFIGTQDRDIFINRQALLLTIDVWTQESRVDIRRGSYLLLLNIVGSRLSTLSGYMCPSDVPIRPQPHCFLQTERWPVGKESAFCPMLQLHLQFQSSILNRGIIPPFLCLTTEPQKRLVKTLA